MDHSTDTADEIPPPLDETTRKNLEELHGKVDAFFDRTRSAYPAAFECGKGCSACCQQTLTLSPVEVARLFEGLNTLDEEALSRMRLRVEEAPESEKAPCPILEEDKCVLYAFRPIICRSHGAPILAQEEERRWKDVCFLNFTGSTSLEDVEVEHVLDLERVNQLLALVNQLALGDEGARRFNLRRALLHWFRRREDS